MNLEKLEKSVRDIVADLDRAEFVYQLLRAYDLPQASITRLKKGDYNRSKNEGEIVWKQKLAFRVFNKETDGDLHSCIDRLESDKTVKKADPRFIIVTDFNSLLAVDTKTEDSIETPFAELSDHVRFFGPWAGREKSQIQSENPADVKAAEKMARLYDLIMVDNPATTDEERHALNMFLSRLLFCFFAEDTGIFKPDQFTNAVASDTGPNGSDLQGYLQKLFAVLATEDRNEFPKHLREFPYVNGGLFCDEYPVPKFNAKSRNIIIECGSLNWKEINPDIFGSMIQAVVHSDQRGAMGIHYTSVVNIMKVIGPLFLNELKEQLDAAGKSKKKLNVLLQRLYNLRIFDPACGSGNFLIIAYKELCRLEIEVFRRLGQSEKGVQMDLFRSGLELTQFYGIELDDFAHETAKLSLWLAEHQMNLEFKKVFGDCKPTLPLTDGGQIVCGNATRVPWEDVCPHVDNVEIYLLGNPPYIGARNQEKHHKKDLEIVFDGHKDFKDADYVSCWYLKAADYIRNTEYVFAFVATNSICQGSQVHIIWPRVLSTATIRFAHQAFKWSNHAKDKAGVTCVVTGVSEVETREKKLYSLEGFKVAENISPYLHDGKTIIVYPAKAATSSVPKMMMGNMPRDGGHLILSNSDYEKLVAEAPEAARFLRRYFGANELLHSTLRWCVWIEDQEIERASSIPQLNERIQGVLKFRTKSEGKTTNEYAKTPHKFAQRNHVEGDTIVLPCHSSENREYIPIGYFSDGSIVSNAAQVIYDASPLIFAPLMSRMHMVWCRTVGGALESRLRYSKTYCYNPFPFPKMNGARSDDLVRNVFNVLDAREQFPERTLAELYDPDEMPSILREAHQEMDLAVEECYRAKPFASDEERLRYLFEMYEKMVEAEKESNAKSKRKSRKGK